MFTTCVDNPDGSEKIHLQSVTTVQAWFSFIESLEIAQFILFLWLKDFYLENN